MVLDTVSKCVLSDFRWILWFSEYLMILVYLGQFCHGWSVGQKIPTQQKMKLEVSVYSPAKGDCGGKSADYFEFPSVEFEFSKWWNAHESNAITSRFNPFKPFRFLRFVPVKRENMHIRKCIKVHTISSIIQNSLFIIVYSKMHVTEKPTAVR